MSATTHSERLAAMIESLSYGSGTFETWDAFVSSFAALIARGCGNESAWLDERAEAARRNIPAKSRDRLPELFEAAVEAFEDEPFQDLLGDTYMRIGIGNKAVGQFFTPYNVSKMMAELAFDEASATTEIERHGYVTVNEPAVGGGANVIAYAGVLAEHGIDYQRKAWFVVQELSELTALSCYVQMSVLGMAGVVLVGDSLRMDFRAALYTPMCVIDDVWSFRAIARMMRDVA